MSKKLICSVVLSIALGGGAFFNAHADSASSPASGSPGIDQPSAKTPENTWQRDRASKSNNQPVKKRSAKKRSVKKQENTWQRDRASKPEDQPKTGSPAKEPENTWQRDRADSPNQQQ